jgi:DNA-binding NarL/FixJ family response regulator
VSRGVRLARVGFDQETNRLESRPHVISYRATLDVPARISRPSALTTEQTATACRLRTSGESVSSIARVLGVSRSTIQRATQI